LSEQTAEFKRNADVMKNLAYTMSIENSYIRSDIADVVDNKAGVMEGVATEGKEY
jgi:hypothetical protein